MSNVGPLQIYLGAVRASLGWRPDVEEVVAEIEDHLHTAVEVLQAQGQELATAEEQAVRRFGDPALVARGFETSSRGRLAVPTSLTRIAGRMGVWAAYLLVFSALLGTVAVTSDARSIGTGRGAEQVPMLLAWIALIAANALVVFLMVGLDRRHGGLGPLGVIGISMAALSAFLTPAVWLFVIWGPLLGTGMLLVAYAMRREDIAPRIATVAFGGGMLVGAIVLLALFTTQLGWRSNNYGDQPLAIIVGIWTAAGVTAGGTYSLGRWLRREEPAELGFGTAVGV